MEPDELHVLHLGTNMYMLGSCLWLLSFRILPRSPRDNVARVWELVTQYYTHNDTTCQFSNLELGMFCEVAKPRSHYPKLKGRGAEVKHLVPAILYAWRQCKRRRNEYDNNVEEMLISQCNAQRILDDYADELFLPPSQAQVYRRHIDKVLSIYTWLADEATKCGDLLWSVVPKHHWLWHLAERCQYLHPRRGATLIDEDFVKHVREIVRACTRATPLHKIPGIMIEKYRWGTHLQNVEYKTQRAQLVYEE